MAFKISLYNSLSKATEPFSPLGGNCVRMYSCGPTVYNYAHIGNMRAFLFADFLQRVLRTVGGYDRKHLSCIFVSRSYAGMYLVYGGVLQGERGSKAGVYL